MIIYRKKSELSYQIVFLWKIRKLAEKISVNKDEMRQKNRPRIYFIHTPLCLTLTINNLI